MAGDVNKIHLTRCATKQGSEETHTDCAIESRQRTRPCPNAAGVKRCSKAANHSAKN